MALPTFVPPIGPSPGTSTEVQLALYEAPFGDGYTQAGPRGLNHMRHTVELNWAGLTADQLATMRTFMEARGGFKPFYYQPPGFLELRKWTCKVWTFTSSAPFTFSTTLIESITNEA